MFKGEKEMSNSIETKCLHAGYNPGNGEPRQVPIYQSTTWKYSTSDDMGRLFDLEASGYFCKWGKCKCIYRGVNIEKYIHNNLAG